MNTIAQLESAMRASNITYLLAMAGANAEIARLRRELAKAQKKTADDKPAAQPKLDL